MPLGKLSKQQIARGFEVLEALEEVLTSSPSSSSLEKLSSQFYTVIPHNFGRNRPPSINSQELLQAKKDMLLVRPQGPQRQVQGWYLAQWLRESDQCAIVSTPCKGLGRVGWVDAEGWVACRGWPH